MTVEHEKHCSDWESKGSKKKNCTNGSNDERDVNEGKKKRQEGVGMGINERREEGKI